MRCLEPDAWAEKIGLSACQCKIMNGVQSTRTKKIDVIKPASLSVHAFQICPRFALMPDMALRVSTMHGAHSATSL
jgi:hypothetical protein